MSVNSINVHGSIAGYYYQVLLGCRELTMMTNENDCVGIEADADIRIIQKCGNKSIEAKFHKDGMSLYDTDIIKTIYNFYNNTAGDNILIFSTNVSLSTEAYKKYLVHCQLLNFG